jgi:hypothetical protein
MDLLLHLNIIKTLSLEYLHQFSNCILLILPIQIFLRYLTINLPVVIELNLQKVCLLELSGGTNVCVLVVARTHPRNTYNKPHPQVNSRLALVMAASMSRVASQNNEAKSAGAAPLQIKHSIIIALMCRLSFVFK